MLSLSSAVLLSYISSWHSTLARTLIEPCTLNIRATFKPRPTCLVSPFLVFFLNPTLLLPTLPANKQTICRKWMPPIGSLPTRKPDGNLICRSDLLRGDWHP
ncbi:hypothetical protein BJV74DRAFT_603705 [Russula compacta]|nr:hypothetical protein BJV74DRAFT_603705 [Russula compacta]